MPKHSDKGSKRQSKASKKDNRGVKKLQNKLSTNTNFSITAEVAAKLISEKQQASEGSNNSATTTATSNTAQSSSEATTPMEITKIEPTNKNKKKSKKK
ncbi:hypothetical protein C9374_008491 [Naegleria lovaniensis]|uniref:Uncharacterized protein n=1 Tax=Naegleria lovaniensis TaxID=51637 RepID=A0AA88GGZ2_NAELO|nr:uncharacterized protein C9374_008491 [Naegleria lovaniensis]KAG2378348.1 hypothetical protein C9374_008491 [Naegleria lovaniensis]